jgi:hypothetical protein
MRRLLTNCFALASVFLLTSVGWSDEGINLCDSLASHPDEPPIGIGVIWDDLEDENAIASCEVAIRDQPETLRFYAQLGRALYKFERFEEAFPIILKAANLGNRLAQVNLGSMYDRAEGVPEHNEKAVEWYRKAAEQGSSDGQYNLGWAYDNGEGVPVDKEKAIEWYTKAAKQGDSDAQYNIGWLYLSGEGIDEDKVKAVEWLTKAAEQGDSDAQYSIGWLYRSGEGIDEDKVKAVEWLTKAAEQGNMDAQYDLGWWYSHGDGIPEDKVKAVEWYTKAAEQGDHAAQYNLGLMYTNGEGIPEDKVKAFEWYTKAAEHGSADAQYNLGWWYSHGDGIPEDKVKAVEWYTRAAAQGNANAQYDLAEMYYWGDGVPEDKAKAIEWYHKAAEQGFSDGQYSLGWVYDNGEGVPVDKVKAVEWYTKAAEQGNLPAQVNLGWYFYSNLQYKEAVEWTKKAAEHPAGWAINNMGEFMEQGYALPWDPEEAFRQYERAAKMGEMFGYFNLARMHFFGNAPLSEYKEALKSIEISVRMAQEEDGNASWEFDYLRNLIVENNEIVAENFLHAIELVKESIVEGDGRGMLFLGQLYEFGSQERRLRQAFRWYYLARKNGVEEKTGDNYGLLEAGYNRVVGALDKDEIFVLMEMADEWYDEWVVRTKEKSLEVVEEKVLGKEQEKIVADAAIAADKARELKKILELRYWESVCSAGNCNDIDLLKSYSNRYPDGEFTDIARIKISRLESKSSPSEPGESDTPTYPDIDFGNYYALVIGNNDYRDDNFSDLKTAVADASAVADILEDNYQFKVTRLLNVSRSDIYKGVYQFREKLNSRDNFLIYYAGHGTIDIDTRVGYWLPVDATETPENWISDADINHMLKAMAAKHVIVVADSCYSGTLTRGFEEVEVERVPSDGLDEAWIRRVMSKRARVALTSGSLEPVVDSDGGKHSVFAKYLIKVLQENEGVITGDQVYDNLKKFVVANSDQTPAFASIRNVGHEFGDFLFVKRAE